MLFPKINCLSLAHPLLYTKEKKNETKSTQQHMHRQYQTRKGISLRYSRSVVVHLWAILYARVRNMDTEAFNARKAHYTYKNDMQIEGNTFSFIIVYTPFLAYKIFYLSCTAFGQISSNLFLCT